MFEHIGVLSPYASDDFTRDSGLSVLAFLSLFFNCVFFVFIVNPFYCHSGLSGIFPEGFPTRFACGNDTKKINIQIVDVLRTLHQYFIAPLPHIEIDTK